jgi:ADP-ribose pyrophosphatase
MSKIKTHFKGRYLSLLEFDDWEYASRSNASGVVVLVAVTDNDELLLVEQYRKPVRKRVIELPAGLIGDHDNAAESAFEAAGRELEEETGFRGRRMEVLMECPSSAGMSDEIIYLILVDELQQTGPGGGDESEDIALHVIPLSEVHDWLQQKMDSGLPVDPKIYSGLYWLSFRGRNQLKS